MTVPSPIVHRVVLASFAMTGIVMAVWAASFWRGAGWLRKDEAWVTVQASGMQELHTTISVLWVVRGRLEASRTKVLSGVVPAGSSAVGGPRHESNWLWQRAEPTRVRSWDDRWHVSRWNEWRLGELGWYQTAGGGSVSRVISVPLWIVAALAGTPCGIGMAAAARARRRRRLGRCVACGYDRRGLAPVVACPECGLCSG